MRRLGTSTLAWGVALLAQAAVAAEASFAVAARADVRTRSPQTGDRGSVITGDLEFVPDVLGALRSNTGLVSLQYNPSLLLREPHGTEDTTFVHRGRLVLSNRWERFTLSLTQEVAQGRLDVGALRNPEGSTPGTLPEVQTVGTVPYVRSATVGAFETQLTARVTFAGSGGYLLSGSPVSGSAMPLQWGPTASGRLRLVATRRDTLTTAVQATSAWFATGQEQQIALVTETWDRRLTTTMTASLGSGVAVTREVIIDAAGGPKLQGATSRCCRW